jgi:hypothetical protein
MSEARIKHGSETFFIEGEGLFTSQVGGRSGEEPDPVTESESPRASAPRALLADAAPPFRFSRVGPRGSALAAGTTKKLARAMTVGGGGHGDVPAGYTYLGQFIDHDLTMDRTAVMLGTDVRPVDLVQGRSPRLDLDSLYGNGPGDPASARFYSDGVHLKTGDTVAAGDPKKLGHDLPRVGTGPHLAAKRRANIPDLRNDENLVVAQTHLAMIHFHNRVVDKLSSSLPATEKFGRARKRVSMHYQWMVRHDYLPRIVRPSVLDDVFTHGRKLVEPGAVPTSVPTMPVEFSVAAFRLGHSMIRSAYNWNKNFPGGEGTLDFLFTFSATSGDLGGDRRLPSNWIADWRRMYDFPAGGRPGLVAPGSNVNHAMRIDTRLTDPLSDLPLGSFGGDASIADGDIRRNLAFRNLTRAKMVKLASGQQMVTRLKSLGVNVTALTRAQLLGGSGGATLDHLTSAEKDAVVTRTPLWFYVLREAELNGGRLKGVGARIVAETFHRAMEGSRFSIVRDPTWRPMLGRNDTTFEMTDLLFFAFAGKKTEINPLG